MAKEWNATITATNKNIVVYKAKSGGFINSKDMETKYRISELRINGEVKR